MLRSMALLVLTIGVAGCGYGDHTPQKTAVLKSDPGPVQGFQCGFDDGNGYACQDASQGLLRPDAAPVIEPCGYDALGIYQCQ